MGYGGGVGEVFEEWVVDIGVCFLVEGGDERVGEEKWRRSWRSKRRRR